ncbi:unnamed protein product [Cylicocyclus nassatus]|uniref:G protein-coupled receptor n=1 Tax=Cylicocyclus nassatus TaxID=53992 RepID=A0AA36DT38_CYLNA|nr:unnamed protein product [Cylicocyclus nassatus]
MTFFVLQLEGVARTQLTHIYTDDLRDKCISAYLDLYEWKTLIIEMHLALLILPVYIAILVLRRKTIVRLHVGWMSERTLRMHSQMLKAITYQACLPLLLSSGLVVFVLGQFLGPNHPILQYSYIAAGLTPVLTPLISLYFIKPYHDSIKQVLLCYPN